MPGLIRDMIAWVSGRVPEVAGREQGVDKARRRDYVQVALDMGLNLPGRNVDDWTKRKDTPPVTSGGLSSRPLCRLKLGGH